MSDPLASPTPWPLAGQGGAAPWSSPEREALARSLERDLRRHVVDPWFPRSVDRENGGFLCDFDRRWRARGAQHRMLEFQARQTRLAAGLALAYPDDGRWHELALHGFHYLRDHMWDAEDGGWFWLLDRSGTPLHGATKHAHGMAYTIGACAIVFLATGERGALDLALRGFEWLEHAHRDDDHGGYRSWVTRDGRPITSAEQVGGLSDPLGGPPDHKDINVHSDLVEAFTELHAAGGDERVRTRLAEVCDVVETRFLLPHGALQYSLTRDWAPVPQLERFGYPLQTTPRLYRARKHLGTGVEQALAGMERAVRHALARAWDTRRGGFWFAAPAIGPDWLEGRRLAVAVRSWWVQAEALRALLLLAFLRPSEPLYAARFGELLDAVRRDVLDERHGGWVAVARGDRRSRLRRLPLRTGSHPKGDVWKDASHEGEMYLACIRMLRGGAFHGPVGARRDTRSRCDRAAPG